MSSQQREIANRITGHTSAAVIGKDYYLTYVSQLFHVRLFPYYHPFTAFPHDKNNDSSMYQKQKSPQEGAFSDNLADFRQDVFTSTDFKDGGLRQQTAVKWQLSVVGCPASCRGRHVALITYLSNSFTISSSPQSSDMIIICFHSVQQLDPPTSG